LNTAHSLRYCISGAVRINWVVVFRDKIPLRPWGRCVESGVMFRFLFRKGCVQLRRRSLRREKRESWYGKRNRSGRQRQKTKTKKSVSVGLYGGGLLSLCGVIVAPRWVFIPHYLVSGQRCASYER
jgi:hypothetical protein